MSQASRTERRHRDVPPRVPALTGRAGDPDSTLFLIGRGPRSLLPGPLRSLYWGLQSRWWDDWRETPEFCARVRLLTDWLRERTGTPRPRLVDLGCGTASVSVELAAAGCDVVGVDVVPGMLRRARSRAGRGPAGSLALVRADLDAPLPFPAAAFDGGLCLATLHCVADPAALLGEIRRMLRPGAPLGLAVVVAEGRVGSIRRWPRLFFNAVRAVPGWRARVRTGTRLDLTRLLADSGFEVLDHRLIGSSLTLLVRAGPLAAAPGVP